MNQGYQQPAQANFNYAFQWTPQANKNWEVAANYTPAILPVEGDTILVDSEIEASTDNFPVVMYLNANNIRLRKTVSKIKELYMAGGTSMSYASGSRFRLEQSCSYQWGSIV